MSEPPSDVNVVEMTAEIVSAYVRNNSVPVGELPALVRSVHDSLRTILHGPKPEPVKEPLQPKVPVKRSVTNEFIVCLEDGKRFKSLKRHLHSEHGLTPQDYRDKWGLARDYPMVAPAYADARSTLARTMGLGRKAGAPATAMPGSGEPLQPEAAAAEPDVSPTEAPAQKPRRGRTKATAEEPV